MTDTTRAVLGALVAAIIGFAIGAGWQYADARRYKDDLETTRYDLTFTRLEAMLGAASIEAQRGNHESARRLASEFFTTLQSEIPTAPAEAQAELQQILAQRDAIITALSRASLESGGVLAELYARYRSAMGEPVGPIPAPGPAPAPDTVAPADTVV